MRNKRLYRSDTDKKISGLCGGIAEYFHMDATFIRLIVAVLIVFSSGTALILYIIACFIVPKNPGIELGGSQGSVYQSGWNEGNVYGHSSTNYRSDSFEPEPIRFTSSDIDEKMKEVEKKAMQKEIEQLKAKLAQYENKQKDKGE